MGGLSAMFSGPPKMRQSTPENPPDPDQEGPLAQEAKRRKLQKRQGASGRSSTILTGAGADYAGGTMG